MGGKRRAFKFAWAVFKMLWSRRDEGWKTMEYRLLSRSPDGSGIATSVITVENTP